MKNVTMYTTKICPYCIRAKKLLDEKGATVKELRIDKNPDFFKEAVEKSGGRTTVPQIFIEDYHVGGCDELYALESEGKLDGLLSD